MSPEESKPRKKYGRRGAGKTQTSVTMSEETLEKAKAAAEKDGRSLSNYIEQLIRRSWLTDNDASEAKK
jgi:predicted HicB family RNase H-like nuclease